MSNAIRTVTLSLPPELANQVDAATQEEGRSRNELLCEAISFYLAERAWQRVLQYGELISSEHGLGPQDVEHAVAEYRDEVQGRQVRKLSWTLTSSYPA